MFLQIADFISNASRIHRFPSFYYQENYSDEECFRCSEQNESLFHIAMLKSKRFMLLFACLILLRYAWMGSGGILFPAAQAEFDTPSLIIEDDNRVIVDSPESYPYSCVSFMDVICECGCGWESSGVVVGNGRTVLTAAHSVYCVLHSSPAESIIFYFGYHNYLKNLYRYDGEWSFITGTSFDSQEYSFLNDWAVVHLEEDIGSLTGILEPVSDISSETDSASEYRIMGYSSGQLYLDNGPLNMMDNTHFEYDMDQESGASGGPILNERNQVVGIIIGHKEEDDGTKKNVGYRMTPEIMNAIYSSGEQ